MRKIDFEAHFFTEQYLDALSDNRGYPRVEAGKENQYRNMRWRDDVSLPYSEALINTLIDLSERRLLEMTEWGIDVQVLSLAAPGVEQLSPETGTALARESNNALAAAIAKHPNRFMGFAALAPKDAKAAADELERAVKDLGFIGWNTHSNYGDSYLDERRYWPILERAEKLQVPIYIHPTVPAIPQVRSHEFALAGATFGFGMETAMLMMRLIYSAVFDRFPGLKIILGHLGEGLPFIVKRIDWAAERPFVPAAGPRLSKKPSEYLKENVFVTTSGNHYEPAFMCTQDAFGIDSILLGTDFPFEDTGECLDYIEGLKISEEDRGKIYSGNARRIGLIK